MRNTRHLLVASFALASALAFTGCAAETETPAMTSPPQFGDGESPGATATTAPDDGASAESADGSDALSISVANALAAIDLAEAETSGVAYELDDEDDRSVWKIDVHVDGVGFEVTVNWEGTQVLSVDQDDTTDRDDLEKLEVATLSMQDAITAAATESSGTLTNADLSEENGVVAWEIEFENERDDDVEVRVNAVTGEIVRID